jgi:hypothetical protein
MPYTTYTTSDLLKKYEEEKETVLQKLIRHTDLSKESVEMLSENLRMMQYELHKRGQQVE